MRLIRLLFLAVATLVSFGCAQNYYNIPRESFEKKVKVLGVAPIFVDTESDIRHPEKDALLALIKESNGKYEKELIKMLRETGSFFSVRPLDGEADKLFASLFFRRERRDVGVIYNKYFFKNEEIKNLLAQNGYDALLLLVVSGLTRQDRVYSGNLLSYLETDYNRLVMTAQIEDAEGTLLWEYPNFRQNKPALPDFIQLQYPDFDEANANLSDKVEVKFKTIPGLTRALNKKEKNLMGEESKLAKSYYAIFDDMISMLKPVPKWFPGEDKKPAPAEGK